MYRFKCCRQNTRHLVQSPQIWRSKLCIACSNFLQKPWRVCTAAAFQLTEPLYLDFRWDSLHAKIPTETMDSVANGAIQYEHTCLSGIFTALGVPGGVALVGQYLPTSSNITATCSVPRNNACICMDFLSLTRMTINKLSILK